MSLGGKSFNLGKWIFLMFSKLLRNFLTPLKDTKIYLKFFSIKLSSPSLVSQSFSKKSKKFIFISWKRSSKKRKKKRAEYLKMFVEGYGNFSFITQLFLFILPHLKYSSRIIKHILFSNIMKRQFTCTVTLVTFTQFKKKVLNFHQKKTFSQTSKEI